MKDIGGVNGTVYGEMGQPGNDGVLKCCYNIQLPDGGSDSPFHNHDSPRFESDIGLPGRVF
jgi:hypothetical protein